MPRGHKSKLRGRKKRQHAQAETQGSKGAQATAAQEEVGPPSSSGLGDAPESSPGAGMLQVSERAPPIIVPAAAIFCCKLEGSQSQDEGSPAPTDPLTRKAGILVQYMMHKYKLKEPILKADMLMIVKDEYMKHFPEIRWRAAERMELVFGLEMKEASHGRASYELVSQMEDSDHGILSGGMGVPKTGFLMSLLGMIFMNDNRASEEEIWELLNKLGLYSGRKHVIFGEPRKLTKDLVREKHLVYQQVAESDPPRYEFLWSPKSRAKTSKMKVLEVLLKMSGAVPCAFPTLYEEALRDMAEKVLARVTTRARKCVVRANSKATSKSASHI